jgi:hypothetical protein
MKTQNKYLICYLTSIIIFICLISIFNSTGNRTKIYKEKFKIHDWTSQSNGFAINNCVIVSFLDIEYFSLNMELKTSNDRSIELIELIKERIRIKERQIIGHWDFERKNIFITILKNIALNTPLFLFFMLISSIVFYKKRKALNIIIRNEKDMIKYCQEKRYKEYLVADYFNERYLNGIRGIISENIQEYNNKFIEIYNKKEYLLYVHLEDIVNIENNRIIKIYYNETKYYNVKIIDNTKIIQEVKKGEYLDIKIVINNIIITEGTYLFIEFNVLELLNNYHENKAKNDSRI